MIKFLHTSDLQLDAPFGFLGERGAAHRQRVRDTLNRIVDLAQRDSYHALLISGDLFNDNRPSRSTVSFVIQTLSKLTIPVCILPGNHDCYDKNSIYRKMEFPRNVHILSDVPSYLDLPELDLTVTGNALLTRHGHESSLKGISRKGDRQWFVVLAHGNVQIPGVVENAERPIQLHEIEACGADYVALGDWHKLADYSQGRVKAFYSGAPEPMALDQDGAGYVVGVTLSDKGVEVNPIHIGTVGVGRLNLDVTDLSEDAVLTQIKAKAGPTLMLDVTLSGLTSVGQVLDVDQVRDAAAKDFYYLRVSDQSHVELANIDPSEFPEIQVIGQYVRMLSQRISQANNERDRRIAERALQLGIALLRGESMPE